MKLHDRIFAIGAFLLGVACLPALFGHIQAPVWTAAVTTGVLAVFAGNYLSMRYRIAAIMVMGQAFLWSVILIKAIH